MGLGSALSGLLGRSKAEAPSPRPQAGYQATETTPFRRPRAKDLRSEGEVANKLTRDQLASDARELRRRSVQAAWIIRTHCTLVGEINFHSTTRNRPLDRAIEQRVRTWSRAANADVGGRHPLSMLLWLAEMGATVDGDILVTINPEGRVHLVPGPRIGFPSEGAPAGITKETHPDGVRVDSDGRPIEYLVCTVESKGGSLKWSATVPAEDAHLHAHFDSPDQVRGVSPMAAALTSFQQVGDAQELALARIKLEQLLGLKITRTQADVADDLPEPVSMDADETADGDDADPVEEEKPGYHIDLSKGIVTFDGDPGDDFELMQGVSPHSNVRDYLREMLAACMKALNLDYSFYDSSHANFSSSRRAEALWQRMSKKRRDAVIETALWIVHRWLKLDIAAGRVSLPEGIETVEDLAIDFVPGGAGWGDVAKEARGYAELLKQRLVSRSEVTRAVTGRDWFDVNDELRSEAEAAPASPDRDSDGSTADLIGSLEQRIADLEDGREDEDSNPDARSAEA